jgi:hypothetical protein
MSEKRRKFDQDFKATQRQPKTNHDPIYANPVNLPRFVTVSNLAESVEVDRRTRCGNGQLRRLLLESANERDGLRD